MTSGCEYCGVQAPSTRDEHTGPHPRGVPIFMLSDLRESWRESWRTYERVGLIEARPYRPGEVLPERVSISAADRDAGRPRTGDMVARNPKNHDDQWLIAADYFEENYRAGFAHGPCVRCGDRAEDEYCQKKCADADG